ncbi:hypothetical protein AVEN_80844-1 [Araneus ventricosus]|uniref:Uncharacterized protein n=1 Tax=Araneus ventricosus TaxID=182803 RepID=A0A4Y2D0Q6_ARAVE|nr:hypothetical protein AVEN_101514-1 [Araneus ventricosus]GBM10274.1 hypothetical protein AVEN_80844-1 [Araneus ventricosus]
MATRTPVSVLELLQRLSLRLPGWFGREGIIQVSVLVSFGTCGSFHANQTQRHLERRLDSRTVPHATRCLPFQTLGDLRADHLFDFGTHVLLLENICKIKSFIFVILLIGLHSRTPQDDFVTISSELWDEEKWECE